jgi:hypothetical protein
MSVAYYYTGYGFFAGVKYGIKISYD